ncbi:sensor histidine kinase [Marispirochaeta aestuarii]|uniref:sensor histidine kinase n=1 Tax=Marispirochaeta aestuarii TaxID=1963862 RepID=UPI0029C79939|nr:sensor histidine kinase [Marispirochaeta aestuarii]
MTKHGSSPEAKVLSKILLMQNVLNKLPTRDSIFSFVCRGIEDFPGVNMVSYRLVDTETPTMAHIRTFPVYVKSSCVGLIEVELAAPECFQPYEAYIHNICYMMAAIFQEWQRQESEAQRADELERLVDERTAQIRQTLQENKLLLKELYHRTRNNMQVISGLLSLQAAKISDPKLAEVLHEVNNRISSIGLIHQKLYESRDLTKLHLDEYVRELAQLLFESYSIAAGRISLELQLDSVVSVIDIALPLGLIINEIISNALKHAFPGETTGKITLRLRSRENMHIELEISDTGVGMPDTDSDYFRDRGSLGLYLIETIVKDQLDGSIRISSGHGTTFNIKIPNTREVTRIPSAAKEGEYDNLHC